RGPEPQAGLGHERPRDRRGDGLRRTEADASSERNRDGRVTELPGALSEGPRALILSPGRLHAAHTFATPQDDRCAGAGGVGPSQWGLAEALHHIGLLAPRRGVLSGVKPRQFRLGALPGGVSVLGGATRVPASA